MQHAYLVPQKAVVHEHTVQAVAQGLVDQGGGHGAVDAARQRADDVLLRPHLWGGECGGAEERPAGSGVLSCAH